MRALTILFGISLYFLAVYIDTTEVVILPKAGFFVIGYFSGFLVAAGIFAEM